MRLAEDGRHRWCGIGANEPILLAAAHARLAQPIKLTQQNAPFDLATSGLHKLVEALLQEESKERAKYVTADRGVR